jgi:hypothetical protein
LLKKISNKIASGVTDGDQISKAVLRSQPPHASDVPEMVAWSQKWSGGSSGFWTKELCHFCSLKGVAPGLHVPGRIFGALSKIDFGTKMPARGIIAILKRMAVSRKVIDNCASDLKVSDIGAIQKPKTKDIFLCANAVMERCHQTLAIKCISDPQATLDQGKLECELIDFVMSKPDPKTAEAKIGEIVDAWLKSLFGDDASADTGTFSGAPASSSTLVQYNDAGQAVDVGKLVLAAKGVKIGNTYVQKTDKDTTIIDDRPIVHKLEAIKGDGTCVVHVLDAFGVRKEESVIEIKGGEFVAQWRLLEKGFKFLANHRGTEIKHNLELGKEAFLHRIKEAMYLQACEMSDYDLVHRTSPTKAVFAKQAYDTGVMLFAPFGSVMAYDPVARRNKAPDARSTVMVDMPDGEGKAMYIMHGPTLDDKTQNTFWAIGSTCTESLANMSIVHREVRFLLPTTGKLRISGHEHVVNIPCFNNCQAIKKDDELLYYVPKVEKKPMVKKDVPELKLPAAKKPKKV